MKLSVAWILMLAMLAGSSAPSWAMEVPNAASNASPSASANGSKELTCRYRDSIANAMIEESHQSHWNSDTEWKKFYELLSSDFRLLAQTEPYKSGLMLEGAFTYFLKFGKFPGRDIYGINHFMNWIVLRPYWNFHSKTEVLSDLLGVIYCPAPEPGTSTDL